MRDSTIPMVWDDLMTKMGPTGSYFENSRPNLESTQISCRLDMELS